VVIVSASPVRWSIKSCGRIATDSSHMEKVQSILGNVRRNPGFFIFEKVTNLRNAVIVRE
jgi:hypothetical protein